MNAARAPASRQFQYPAADRHRRRRLSDGAGERDSRHRCVRAGAGRGLGLDASEHDPLKGMSITTNGFSRIGSAIAGIGLPTVIVQEAAISPMCSAKPHGVPEWFRGRAVGCSSSLRAYETEYAFSFSRRDAPGVLHFVVPLRIRGRRESRVHAVPAVSCAMCIKKCCT